MCSLDQQFIAEAAYDGTPWADETLTYASGRGPRLKHVRRARRPTPGPSATGTVSRRVPPGDRALERQGLERSRTSSLQSAPTDSFGVTDISANQRLRRGGDGGLIEHWHGAPGTASCTLRAISAREGAARSDLVPLIKPDPTRCRVLTVGFLGELELEPVLGVAACASIDARLCWLVGVVAQPRAGEGDLLGTVSHGV